MAVEGKGRKKARAGSSSSCLGSTRNGFAVDSDTSAWARPEAGCGPVFAFVAAAGGAIETVIAEAGVLCRIVLYKQDTT